MVEIGQERADDGGIWMADLVMPIVFGKSAGSKRRLDLEVDVVFLRRRKHQDPGSWI